MYSMILLVGCLQCKVEISNELVTHVLMFLLHLDSGIEISKTDRYNVTSNR
jgi:hypothetical protein